jgi:hypothetical protein
MEKKFELMKKICESVFSEKIYYNDFETDDKYKDFLINEMSYVEELIFDKSVDENIHALYEELYYVLEKSTPQTKNTTLFLAIHTKAKTEDKLKQIIKNNPKNPPIDLSVVPLNGPYGTPEEMREFLKLDRFNIVNTFTNSNDSFVVEVKYENGEWAVVE